MQVIVSLCFLHFFHSFHYQYCHSVCSYIMAWTKEHCEMPVFCPGLETDYIHRCQGHVSVTCVLESLHTDRKGWIIVIVFLTLRQSPYKFLSTSWEFSLCFHIKAAITSELISLFCSMVLSRQAIPMLTKHCRCYCRCNPGAFISSSSVVKFPRFDWPV